MRIIKSVFTFSFIVCSVIVWSEDFYVLHLKGNIKSQSGGLLKTGDKITSKEKITFGTSNDMAVVMSTTRGRLVLKSTASQSTDELSFVVNNILHPSTGKLSTRAGAILSMLDLEKALSVENFVIIDTSSIEVPSNVLKLDETHFCFIRYDYKGETINKKLSTNGNTIKFTKEILTVDDQPISEDDISNVTFWYYDASAKKSMKISTMNLSFVDSLSLKSEWQVMKNVNSKVDSEELYDYINEVYGYLSKDDFQNWFDSL